MGGNGPLSVRAGPPDRNFAAGARSLDRLRSPNSFLEQSFSRDLGP
jgi:hypothetical protein